MISKKDKNYFFALQSFPLLISTIRIEIRYLAKIGFVIPWPELDGRLEFGKMI